MTILLMIEVLVFLSRAIPVIVFVDLKVAWIQKLIEFAILCKLKLSIEKAKRNIII